MSTLTLVAGTATTGGDWSARAACADADADLFFPERGTPSAQIMQAKRICASCPVRQACLEDALRRNEPDAICGGLTAQERAQQTGTPRIRRQGRASGRELAVKHGSFLLVSLVGHQMSVEQVAEQLGSTPSAVYCAYLMLVPARRGHARPKPPSAIEKLLATSTERLRTMHRLGRSQEYMADLLETSQSIVSACLSVLRQRDDAVDKLAHVGGLRRLQDEEFRIRLESGTGLTVDDVIRAAGRSILRKHGEGTPLREVARELGMCRETVRKAYQQMTKSRFEKDLTQNQMEEAA